MKELWNEIKGELSWPFLIILFIMAFGFYLFLIQIIIFKDRVLQDQGFSRPIPSNFATKPPTSKETLLYDGNKD